MGWGLPEMRKGSWGGGHFKEQGQKWGAPYPPTPVSLFLPHSLQVMFTERPQDRAEGDLALFCQLGCHLQGRMGTQARRSSAGYPHHPPSLKTQSSGERGSRSSPSSTPAQPLWIFLLGERSRGPYLSLFTPASQWGVETDTGSERRGRREGRGILGLSNDSREGSTGGIAK